MTSARQVLLELIRYASDQGKPALLNLRAERIAELRNRGLIELREDGYWITELGRGQCPRQELHDREVASPNTTELRSALEAPAARYGNRALADLPVAWRRLVKQR